MKRRRGSEQVKRTFVTENHQSLRNLGKNRLIKISAMANFVMLSSQIMQALSVAGRRGNRTHKDCNAAESA
jgi:hypothetical protein